MALEGLPPWLQVSPRDFVLAAAQGAQLGHQIADSTMRAWEEQARMRMASQEAAANREERASERESHDALTRLETDRLEQYRQSEIANRKSELGLRGQELGIQSKGLEFRGLRESDLEEARQQRIKDAEERHKDQLTQIEFMNDMRKRAAERDDRDLKRKEDLLDKTRPVTTKLSADEFGPELSGPINDPAIVQRIQQRASKVKEPGLLERAYNYVTGTTPTPPPSAGTVPMNPAYPHPNDVAAPPPSTIQSTTSKVQKAKDLYQKHPDWTKQQVIDAVNSGAE